MMEACHPVRHQNKVHSILQIYPSRSKHADGFVRHDKSISLKIYDEGRHAETWTRDSAETGSAGLSPRSM